MPISADTIIFVSMTILCISHRVDFGVDVVKCKCKKSGLLCNPITFQKRFLSILDADLFLELVKGDAVAFESELVVLKIVNLDR